MRNGLVKHDVHQFFTLCSYRFEHMAANEIRASNLICLVHDPSLRMLRDMYTATEKDFLTSTRISVSQVQEGTTEIAIQDESRLIRCSVFEVCPAFVAISETCAPPGTFLTHFLPLKRETLCLPDVEEQFADHVSSRCVGQLETGAKSAEKDRLNIPALCVSRK